MEDSKVLWSNEEEEGAVKRNYCLRCLRKFVDVKQTLVYESKVLSRSEKKSASRDLLAQHQRSELVIRYAHWVLKALRKNDCEKGQIQELAEKSKVKDMLKPSTNQLQKQAFQTKNKKRGLSSANANNNISIEYSKQEHAVADADRMLVNNAAAQQNPTLILQ